MREREANSTCGIKTKESKITTIHSESKKCAFTSFITALTFADFYNSFTSIFSIKFATKCMPHFPSHLKDVSAISCKIQNTEIGDILLDLTQ